MFRRFATTALFTTLIMTKPVHAQGIIKDHHDGSRFKNPWPSFVSYGFIDAFKMITGSDKSILSAVKPTDMPEKVEIDWKLLKQKDDGKLRATWLGQ